MRGHVNEISKSNVRIGLSSKYMRCKTHWWVMDSICHQSVCSSSLTASYITGFRVTGEIDVSHVFRQLRGTPVNNGDQNAEPFLGPAAEQAVDTLLVSAPPHCGSDDLPGDG